MKIRSLLVILASLVLVSLVAVGVGWATITGDARFDSAIPSYTAGHANAANVSEAVCSTCHSSLGNVHWRHQASIFLGFHDSFDSTSSPLPLNGCGRCHSQGVTPNGGGTLNEAVGGSGYEGDLSYADTSTVFAGKIRKQVSPDICRRCHGQFRSDIGGHAVVTLASKCTSGACHNIGSGSMATGRGADVAHTGVTWLNRPIADYVSDSACTMCHGADGTGAVQNDGISPSGRVWFDTTETNPNPGSTWP